MLVTIAIIVGYGAWKSRGNKDLEGYLKGDSSLKWGTIGLSIMATQASAITFLSTPGLGYENGLRFVQNYLGLPIAMVIICSFFLPLYRKLKVYTAYEYLGHRFDQKTRRLGALLFLLQRGLAAGITLYAPAIILSTVFGWNLQLTILMAGVLVIGYTVSGGTKAVSITQKWQMSIIMAGMFAAFGILVFQLRQFLSLEQAFSIAGSVGKLEAIDFSLSFEERYTFWSGLLGGTFLALSYFGTDQSQVQRYLSGTSLTESRFALLFNGMVKIPMQFFILLIGVLVFVLYQFVPAPIFFRQASWATLQQSEYQQSAKELEDRYQQNFREKKQNFQEWVAHDREGRSHQAETAFEAGRELIEKEALIRAEAKDLLREFDPKIEVKDSDYIFIDYVLEFLPKGMVGLLVAVIFCAAMSSTASELNALASTVVIDFYRPIVKPNASDEHYVKASRWFTGLWGGVALSFALVAYLVENLIEAVNILGSIFYGVVLGIFLVAFFFKSIKSNAVFYAAITAQVLVLLLFWQTDIGYLWFNVIGCSLTVLLSLLLRKLD